VDTRFGGTVVNVPAGYDPLLKQMQQGTGIPYNVLAAQAQAESNFSATAVSSTGAEGWLQFEPTTYQSVAGAAGVPPNSEFNPSDEAKAYIVFMNQLLKQEGGDVRKALEAYNAGPGNLAAGAQYANGILSAAGQPDITVAGTTDIHIPGTGINIPTSPGGMVKDAINSVLGMLGLGSLQDMFERLGLILLGAALVLLGIHILSGGNPPYKQQTTTETTPEGTTTTKKTRHPFGSSETSEGPEGTSTTRTHKFGGSSATTKTATRSLEAEAAEAAVVA